MTEFMFFILYLAGCVGYCIPHRDDEPLGFKIIWASIAWPVVAAILTGAWVARQRKI